MAYPEKLPDEARGENTKSEKNRFPEDIVLRSYGFHIHSRKKGRQAVWERRGETFTHSEALKVVRKEAEEKRKPK